LSVEHQETILNMAAEQSGDGLHRYDCEGSDQPVSPLADPAFLPTQKQKNRPKNNRNHSAPMMKMHWLRIDVAPLPLEVPLNGQEGHSVHSHLCSSWRRRVTFWLVETSVTARARFLAFKAQNLNGLFCVYNEDKDIQGARCAPISESGPTNAETSTMTGSFNKESASQTLEIRGLECCVHAWNVDDASQSRPRAMVVIYHGFLAHGKYPTVRYAAELLAAYGFAVVAADMPGHGKSPGTRGYLPSADNLIQDGIAVAEYADKLFDDLPLFLLGSSMGGTIALSVAKELGDRVSGVVLLAPMLAIDVNEPSRVLLKALSYVAPTLTVIPSSSTSPEMQYRDPEKRKECQDDELSIHGSFIRIGSASTCVELAKTIRTAFLVISCPFICMVGTEDAVVDNAGALELMEVSPSQDKTLKEYAALHGLLCEPSPLVDEIHSDLLAWIKERTS